MLGIGESFFIQKSTESKTRILHPAKMVGVNDGAYTAEIEEAGVLPDEGAEFQIYFETAKDFLKQAATVQAVHTDEPTPTIEFIIVGDPVSAESRQYFRVSTVMSNLTATLGDESDCELLNVSTVGFCVLATAHYDIGSTAGASMSHQGVLYAGRGCVQSIRSMDKDQIRYGLHAVDTNGLSGNLEAGLRRMTTAIQREQLWRISASG